MGRTVLIMTAGVLATLFLIKWAVDVSFAGAAANVLADFAVVGMITVFARSWILRLRRSLFSAELRQSQSEARLTVDAWIVAQREKRDQYSHLLGGSGSAGSPSVSYRESRAGALRVLPSLQDAAGGDELRQAVQRVSAAEQAAKAQRVRLHNVLDPVFREWITAKFPGLLPRKLERI